jgi:acid stress-induced BolA-like protein IbaG/YrbA
MQIDESAIEKLKLVNGPIGDIVKKKIHAVTEKNPGYTDFKTNNDNEWHPSKHLEISSSDILRLICSNYIG